jgi:hypothetical protein
MELKVFVTETIKEIIQGVVEAQKHIIPNINHATEGYVQIGHDSLMEKIEFDISVTSSESSGGEAKAGVFIKVVDFGVKNNTANNNTSTNRIKFNVPIAFPMQANKKFS